MILKVEQWLAFAFFGLIVVFAGAVSLSFYAQLREATLVRTQNQLLSINILKKRLIEQYLNTVSAPLNADPTVSLTPTMTASLEAIVTERTGMGATGESYLVDEQNRMLTVSRFFPDTLPNSISVNTEGVRRARAGQEGVSLYPDYRDVPIVGAYRPIKLGSQSGVLLTEIDVAEALQPVVALRNRFLWLSLLLLIASGLVSVGLAKLLSRPIRTLQQNIAMLARGELPPATVRGSQVEEIESMSASLNELIQALNRTARFARHIGEGGFDAAYTPLSVGDELGHALLNMRDQLVQLNVQQERSERETKKRLVSAQESERERIARDIHDGIGPLLTTAKLKLSSLPDSPEREETQRLLGEVLAEVRRISRNLMPSVLSDFGPGEALKQLANQMNDSTSVHFRYVNDLLDDSHLPKETSIALYRIAQEAINNTLKHAAATEAVLSLTEFDDRVVFYYQDNGQGLDKKVAKAATGHGLKNIRERIRILNGNVRIYSHRGTSVRGTSVRGTVIEAEIPLP